MSPVMRPVDIGTRPFDQLTIACGARTLTE